MHKEMRCLLRVIYIGYYVLLFSTAKAAASAVDVSPFRSYCYQPLCHQKDAYYVHETGFLELFVDPLNLAQDEVRVCFTINGLHLGQAFCDPESNGLFRLLVPTDPPFTPPVIQSTRLLVLNRLVAYANGSTFLFPAAETHFVAHYLHVPPSINDNDDDKSILGIAKVQIKRPTFGALMSQLLYIEFQGNEAVLANASSVYFNSKDVFQSHFDVTTTYIGSLVGSENDKDEHGLEQGEKQEQQQDEGGEQEKKFDEAAYKERAIEPGSWFFSLTPIFPSPLLSHASASPMHTAAAEEGSADRSQGEASMLQQEEQLQQHEHQQQLQQQHAVYPSSGYIEFVLPRAEMARNRRFAFKDNSALGDDDDDDDDDDADDKVATSSSAAVAAAKDLISESNGLNNNTNKKYHHQHQQQQQQQRSEEQSQEKEKARTNICIWGSSKMDGQKKIWIDQMQVHEHAHTNVHAQTCTHTLASSCTLTLATHTINHTLTRTQTHTIQTHLTNTHTHNNLEHTKKIKANGCERV